ncbi:DUF3622 domain-containing protein [Psychromonas antarctica]|jgi:hypothetical protein|uniref:DUF3622 domain-containing protein n=1 Tax=Psychromonas antarctica TaxID=67573 RepID=UPI001EE986C7|nr:DUF3622 domain-containing protein [Psychromonas antarctica]MCG6201339.1 DUF3622 domain-containing protein [Psychromonas antarctica]
MAQENKFDYGIKQDGEKWDAEIIRRVSARRTSVSKRKKGFATEELAEQWAKEQLADFLDNLQASNKRKAERRDTRNELAAKAEADKQAAAALYTEKRLAALALADEEEDDAHIEE